MGDRGSSATPPTVEELFRLMREAPESCRSLMASYVRWADPPTIASAVGAVESVDDEPLRRAGRVWIDGDARVRSEQEGAVAVVNGAEWYARSPDQFIGSAVKGGELGIERLEEARYPFTFIPEFGHVSRGEVAGRRCWLVHGRRRDGDPSHPRVAAGDEWRFAIDAATGIAPKIESFWRGAPSTLLEITQLEIAPTFDETLFEIEEAPAS